LAFSHSFSIFSSFYMKKFFESGFGRALLRSRYRILLTYGLAIVGSFFVFLYPLLTGKAIDGVLAGSSNGVFILIAVWSVHLAIDYFRMRYDTITFANLHAGVATEMIEAQRAQGAETSTVAARAAMLQEITDYFAYQVPGILMFLVSPIGAFVAIWFFDVPTGIFATVYVIAGLLFMRFVYPRSKDLNRTLNDQQERTVNVIEARDSIGAHFKGLATAAISISNMSANIDALLEVGRIAMTLFFILRLGQVGEISVGEAYAMVNYVWRLTDGVNYVPVIAQQIARLGDIRRRVAEGEELD
jgi:ATP-binding cassette, subfamily B, bacterial